jgi:hypothetical protein
LCIAISFIYALVGALSGKTFGEKDRKIGLLGLIPTHIQFLVGLILYFLSPVGFSNLGPGTMSDSMSRLYALEHPVINVIAVALITVGYSRAKKLTDSRNQFRSIYMFYGIAFILILSRIPWAAWLN